MMRLIERMLAVITLGTCVVVIACCGGSQSPQPTHSQVTPALATGPHILGDAQANVTIIKFCDFQCPYCKSFHSETEWQIVNEYVSTGKAKIAYRHFPLSFHQNAQISAEASECAAKVGGNDAFWKYHDILFIKGGSDGSGLDALSLKQYAADMQLDAASFNTCIDNHEFATAVSSDLADGAAAGVNGTPTFFINGKPLVGAVPYTTFKAAIDAAN